MTRWIMAALVASLATFGSERAARAMPDAPTVELGWRWALAPTSDDGVRLLDSLELASLVGVRGDFALLPSIAYGVSYGTPWVALYGVALEGMYSPARARIVPRVGGGLAGQFEAVVREGRERKRDSFRGDLMLVARVGVDFVRARRVFGIDLRLAVGPRDALAFAGPLDIGLNFRGGFVGAR